MKNTHNKLTCLFGYHDYSDKFTKDKRGFPTYLCEVCKKSGYWKYPNGDVHWDEYDEERNLIHRKWSDGFESWHDYNKKGNMIHSKYFDDDKRWSERWLNDDGDWVRKKPENWKYEK